MNTRNLLISLLSLILCLALAGGTWNTVLAVEDFSSTNFELTYQQPAEVYLGRGGVYMVSSAYTATAVINRIKPNKTYPKQGLEFVDRWIEFRIYDNRGVAFQTLWGFNYVYFNLTHEHRTLWDKNLLSIYYWDSLLGKWVVCPSFLVADENLPHGRVTCVMQNFGIYGLAMTN